MSFDDDTTEEHERRITRCREQSCRARIIFLPTPNGKSMPVDADTVEASDVEYDPERGHVSHYTTCTRPNRFSKGGKK